MSKDEYTEAEKKDLRAFLDEREARTLFQGLILGLMAGITVLHGIQPIAALVGSLPWVPKMWVAVAGAVLYGTCAVGLYFGVRSDGTGGRWALRSALVGPLEGFPALVVGFFLGTAVRPDVWTWGGAVLQVPAQVLAVVLLHPPRHKVP